MGSEAPRQSFWAQNRWALPLLLALIIVIVVGAAILGPKIKSASSSPTVTPTSAPTATAKPKTIVVTATPAAGTPTTARTLTPGAAQPGATATPANGQGASTPLPAASPIPTEQGKTLGMITHNDAPTIQQKAAAGAAGYAFYLNPVQVIMNTLPNYGFPKGSFQVTQPAAGAPTPTPFVDQSGRPTIRFIVTYQGRKYQVAVTQPETHGPKGIWLIVTILPPGSY